MSSSINVMLYVTVDYKSHTRIQRIGLQTKSSRQLELLLKEKEVLSLVILRLVKLALKDCIWIVIHNMFMMPWDHLPWTPHQCSATG